MSDGNSDMNMGSELPPYHHQSEDIGAACGVNLDREGGVKEVAEKVGEYLSEVDRSEGGVHTSQIVEVIERSTLNSREKIMLAVMIGVAKGVKDSPEILARMVRVIEGHEGRDRFDMF